MAQRATWAVEQRYGRLSGDSSIEVTCGEQGVTVAVTQEKAMDSYNADFTCEIVLSDDEAREMLKVLHEALT